MKCWLKLDASNVVLPKGKEKNPKWSGNPSSHVENRDIGDNLNGIAQLRIKPGEAF